MDMETRFCSNCKKDVAYHNFTIHSAHCSRNIIVCDLCDEPVPFKCIEDHKMEFHTKVPCDKCFEIVEQGRLEDHKIHNCSKRPIQCAYCEIKHPYDEFADHESYCGSRTERCISCKDYVMLREKELHTKEKCSVLHKSTVWSKAKIYSSSSSFEEKELPPIGYNRSTKLSSQTTFSDNKKPFSLFDNQSVKFALSDVIQKCKMTYCDFCEQPVPCNELSDHVLECEKRNIKCSKCGDIVNIKDDEEHYKICHRKETGKQKHKMIFCTFCEKPFSSVDVLSGHLLICEKKNIQSLKYGATISIKDEVKHLTECFGHEPLTQRHKKVYCDFCKQPFISDDMLSDHLLICEKKNIRCLKCGSIIDVKDEVKHCEECFGYKSITQRHKKVYCGFCKQPFLSDDILSHHLLTCEKKNIQCSKCGYIIDVKDEAKHYKECFGYESIQTDHSWSTRHDLLQKSDENFMYGSSKKNFNIFNLLRDSDDCNQFFHGNAYHQTRKSSQEEEHSAYSKTKMSTDVSEADVVIASEQVNIFDMPESHLKTSVAKKSSSYADACKNKQSYEPDTKQTYNFKDTEYPELMISHTTNPGSFFNKNVNEENILKLKNDSECCRACPHKSDKYSTSEKTNTSERCRDPSVKEKNKRKQKGEKKTKHDATRNNKKGFGNSKTKNDEPIVLPCEFCEELFPENIIVEHQSGCRPDLLHFPKDCFEQEERETRHSVENFMGAISSTVVNSNPNENNIVEEFKGYYSESNKNPDRYEERLPRYVISENQREQQYDSKHFVLQQQQHSFVQKSQHTFDDTETVPSAVHNGVSAVRNLPLQSVNNSKNEVERELRRYGIQHKAVWSRYVSSDSADEPPENKISTKHSNFTGSHHRMSYDNTVPGEFLDNLSSMKIIKKPDVLEVSSSSATPFRQVQRSVLDNCYDEQESRKQVNNCSYLNKRMLQSKDMDNNYDSKDTNSTFIKATNNKSSTELVSEIAKLGDRFQMLYTDDKESGDEQFHAEQALNVKQHKTYKDEGLNYFSPLHVPDDNVAVKERENTTLFSSNNELHSSNQACALPKNKNMRSSVENNNFYCERDGQQKKCKKSKNFIAEENSTVHVKVEDQTKNNRKSRFFIFGTRNSK